MMTPLTDHFRGMIIAGFEVSQTAIKAEPTCSLNEGIFVPTLAGMSC